MDARANEETGRIRAERDLRASLMCTSASRSLRRLKTMQVANTPSPCIKTSTKHVASGASTETLPPRGANKIKWSLTVTAPLICSPVGTFLKFQSPQRDLDSRSGSYGAWGGRSSPACVWSGTQGCGVQSRLDHFHVSCEH